MKIIKFKNDKDKLLDYIKDKLAIKKAKKYCKKYYNRDLRF